MRLLRALDVPVATVTILRFGQCTVVGVERFDGRLSSRGWLRLPQEDFAQAFGVAPDNKFGRSDDLKLE